MGRAAALSAAAAAAAAALAVFLHNHLRGKAKKLDKLEPVVLKNKQGVEVHITPVGASIQRLIVPVGSKKQLQDVVLGFNKPSTYAVRRKCTHGSHQKIPVTVELKEL